MPSPPLIDDTADRAWLEIAANGLEQIGIRHQDALLEQSDDEYADAYTAVMMAVQTLRDIAAETITCPDCAGASPIAGVRWPVQVNGDETQPWVERCDSCEQYESDGAAAAALAQAIGGLIGYGHVFGGLQDSYPYVLAPKEEKSDG